MIIKKGMKLNSQLKSSPVFLSKARPLVVTSAHYIYMHSVAEGQWRQGKGKPTGLNEGSASAKFSNFKNYEKIPWSEKLEVNDGAIPSTKDSK